MPEASPSFSLEVFRNTCAGCGHQFETLGDTQAYGWILYVSDKGELRFIDSYSDAVWKEAAIITEGLIGRKIEDMDDAGIFHELLPLTFDPPSPGDVIRDHERQPCPRCRSTRRSVFGPYNPCRTRNVRIAPVEHERWSKLSNDEKREMFRDYLGRRQAVLAAIVPEVTRILDTALDRTRHWKARTSEAMLLSQLQLLETILENVLRDAQVKGEVPAVPLVDWVAKWIPDAADPLVDALAAFERLAIERRNRPT